jgi:hypothetical protein
VNLCIGHSQATPRRRPPADRHPLRTIEVVSEAVAVGETRRCRRSMAVHRGRSLVDSAPTKMPALERVRIRRHLRRCHRRPPTSKEAHLATRDQLPAVEHYYPFFTSPERAALTGFLAGYSGLTREGLRARRASVRHLVRRTSPRALLCASSRHRVPSPENWNSKDGRETTIVRRSGTVAARGAPRRNAAPVAKAWNYFFSDVLGWRLRVGNVNRDRCRSLTCIWIRELTDR